MVAELKKAMKPCESIFPKRPLTMVRLIHNCKQLLVKSFTATSPEPLETMLVAMPKAFKLPVRVGTVEGSSLVFEDNRARSWTNLSMRPEQCVALCSVPETMYRQVLGVSDSAGEGHEDMASEHEGVKSDEEDDGEDEGRSGPCTPPSTLLLFPWELPEEVYRNIYRAFCKDASSKTWVVDICAGSGLAALAAARDGHHYIGWARTESHRVFIQQFVLLHICLDLVLGNGGFRMGNKRVLSKQNSLTGTEAPPSEAAGAGPTPSPSKKAKSSSSSSDS